MPNLADHQSNDFVKLLLVGDAKSGKTGSLVSLAKAGYKLRILDMDNLLDILKYLVQKEAPEAMPNIEFCTIRDKRKASVSGSIIDGKPKAWVDALKMLDRWKYKTESGDEVDLGVPAEWGRDCILVIDSLSRLCDAAYDFHEVMTPAGKGGEQDGRAVYGNAQNDVENFLGMLTGKGFATNVIVIAHVAYMEQNGGIKGFPQGIGQKLSPKIPSYFPSVVLYTNKAGKRTLQTNSTPMMDLANPAPFAMQPSYPVDTGLADFFAVLREPPAKPEKPKALTLKRA